MANYALRIGADPLPAWRVNAPLNEFIEISGTSGAGGAAIDAFSGIAIVGTKIVIAAAGGHGSGLDNRVVSLDLSQNSPSWTTRMESSVSGTNDVAYYADGKPASRHTYHFIHTIPGNKVLLGGCRFTFNGALDLNTVDAFDLDTDTWDGIVAGSPGTSGSGYTSLTPSGYYLAAQDGDGNLWSFLHTTGATAKYTVATNTWSTPIASPVSPSVRYPWAWDSPRNQLFGLSCGDGEGSASDIRAIKQNGTTQTAITFSAGSAAAVAEFESDAPQYAAMDYDAPNDRFLFYECYSDTKKMFAITPNAGTEWDMEILNIGGAVTPTAAPGTKGAFNFAGVQNRFKYLPNYGGFILLSRSSANLYFLRTV